MKGVISMFKKFEKFAVVFTSLEFIGIVVLGVYHKGAIDSMKKAQKSMEEN